jgi:hypothetical protein
MSAASFTTLPVSHSPILDLSSESFPLKALPPTTEPASAPVPPAEQPASETKPDNAVVPTAAGEIGKEVLVELKPLIEALKHVKNIRVKARDVSGKEGRRLADN